MFEHVKQHIVAKQAINELQKNRIDVNKFSIAIYNYQYPKNGRAWINLVNKIEKSVKNHEILAIPKSKCGDFKQFAERVGFEITRSQLIHESKQNKFQYFSIKYT